MSQALSRTEKGFAIALTSSGSGDPWALHATIEQTERGTRKIEAVFRDILLKDVFLALRLTPLPVDTDIPISAVVRAEIAATGILQSAEGRILGGSGFVGSKEASGRRLAVDEAQIAFSWDAQAGVMRVPIQLNLGTYRLIMLAYAYSPPRLTDPWKISVTRGSLSPPSEPSAREPSVFDDIFLHGSVDLRAQRIVVDQAQLIGRAASFSIGGVVDYASGEPKLTVNLSAGRLKIPSLNAACPFFARTSFCTLTRNHLLDGTIDRMGLANDFFPNLDGADLFKLTDALAFDISGRGMTIKLIDDLPPIHGADISAKIENGHATVYIGPTAITLPSGNRLTVSRATLEIHDLNHENIRVQGTVRIDGRVSAAAEFLAMHPMRTQWGRLPLDFTLSEGLISSQIVFEAPIRPELFGSRLQYAIEADISNFSLRHVGATKIEAGSFRLKATPQAYQISGFARVNGARTSLDYEGDLVTPLRPK